MQPSSSHHNRTTSKQQTSIAARQQLHLSSRSRDIADTLSDAGDGVLEGEGEPGGAAARGRQATFGTITDVDVEVGGGVLVA